MNRTKARLSLSLLLLLTNLAVVPQSSAEEISERMIEIERINVTGTHCPASSIIALSGLKLHDKVNEIGVNTACQDYGDRFFQVD